MGISKRSVPFRLLVIALLSLMEWGVWHFRSNREATVTNPNELLLSQVRQSTAWFHARKTRPIWGRKLSSPETVTTLEGIEQVDAGEYLCRGEAGDIWPQSEKDLLRRYVPASDPASDGWQKYVPNPDAKGVMAIQMERPFEVIASWGALQGKAGDFLLKNFEDRDNLEPVDLWIVDQQLFGETYERQNGI